jgi:ribosomal-protein-alanine N-acetyltransferase
MIPTLETDRLILREPRREDFPVYEAFFDDAVASAAYGGPLSSGQAWRVLATDLGHWALRGYGRWAGTVKQSGEMIGGCGLWWPEAYPRSELTWWIIPSARKKGYAKEASLAAIKFGYETLGWPLVETHMNDENEPARRLVEALGGKVIGREAFPDGLTRNIYGLPEPV